MSILFNNELTQHLQQKLLTVDRTILVLSAFVKVAALEELLDDLPKRQLDLTIVARWQPQDLISGASDIHAYEFAKKNGWRFFVNPNMHYKIYLLDNELLFLGSANLTQKGLHIGIPGNDEASIQVTPTDIDIERLKRYVNSSCKVDDDLFSDIKNALQDIEKYPSTRPEGICWPIKIQKELQKSFKYLWVNDLLFCSPLETYEQDSHAFIHDSVLLKTNDRSFNDSKENLQKSLYSLPVWKWLINTVSESESEFVRFGEITAKLHDALLDDPKPYRREVKSFVSNMFGWIQYLTPSTIGVKKFNRTKALFMQK